VDSQLLCDEFLLQCFLAKPFVVLTLEGISTIGPSRVTITFYRSHRMAMHAAAVELSYQH
jgi:hypothetical protein